MSNQFEFIDENEICNLFQSVLQEIKAGDAFDQILDELNNEELAAAYV